VKTEVGCVTVLLPAVALAAILLILSLIHWYWAFGGTRGLAAALPTKPSGEPLLSPGRLSAAGVAVALLVAAALALWPACPYAVGPPWLQRGGVWGIALVFTARAVGDGRYVGFSKRVRNTDFGRRDSRLYSPLCALIAFLAIWLARFHP